MAGSKLMVVLAGVSLLAAGPSFAQGNSMPGAGFAAVPGLKGGQDIYGPYEPVANWPKPLAESMPELEGWTWSVTMDVFAESPDRIYLVQKGILPIIEPGPREWRPEIGVGIRFPIFRLPLRQAGGAIPNRPSWEPSCCW